MIMSVGWGWEEGAGNKGKTLKCIIVVTLSERQIFTLEDAHK